MDLLHRIVGLAAVASLVLVPGGAHAAMSSQGAIVELRPSSGQFDFLHGDLTGTAQVTYYNGVLPCRNAGVSRLSPSSEAVLIEAFKNNWKVRVEYITVGSVRCVHALYVTK